MASIKQASSHLAHPDILPLRDFRPGTALDEFCTSGQLQLARFCYLQLAELPLHAGHERAVMACCSSHGPSYSPSLGNESGQEMCLSYSLP